VEKERGGIGLPRAQMVECVRLERDFGDCDRFQTPASTLASGMASGIKRRAGQFRCNLGGIQPRDEELAGEKRRSAAGREGKGQRQDRRTADKRYI